MSDTSQFDFSGSLLDIVNYALSLDISGKVPIVDEHGRRGELLFAERRLRQIWLEGMTGEDAFKALADCTAIQCSTNVREYVEEVPLDFDFESVRKSIETGELIRPVAPPRAEEAAASTPPAEQPIPVAAKSGSGKTIALVAVAALALIAVVVVMMRDQSPPASPTQGSAPSAAAQPAPVETPVSAEGKIAMRSAVNFSHDIPGLALKILSLAPENSQVKKGDLLVELDRAAIEARIKSYRADLAKAQNDIKQINTKALVERNKFQDAIKTLETSAGPAARSAESGNPAEIKQARTALEKANADLQKAKRDLALAKDMLKKGLVSADEATQASERLTLVQDAHSQAKTAYDKASGNSGGEAPKNTRGEMLDQLRNRAQETEKRYQASVQAAQAAQRSAENQIRATEAQLKKTRILSTLAGVVTAARKSGNALKVGDTVRSGQQIVSVSEAERMVVSVKISRADASKVRLDQAVKLQFPEVPGLTLVGKVNNLSVQGEGDKGYLVEIILSGTDGRLRNGMTAHATIGGG